jgi:hypothetical protein
MSSHVAQYLQRRTVVTVEAEQVEAERVEAEQIEAEQVEAEQVEAEQVEAEQVEAEQVEADCTSTAVRLRQGVMGGYDDSTRI